MSPLRIGVLSVAVVLCSIMGASVVSAQERLTREQYILKYREIALEHMDVYGIPASIKLAQALLESDNGNGRLAREANNHFGIKCKSDWKGETITHDDDAAAECFRKYPSVEESFKDHSEFLDKSARYQDLFKLDPKDYKGWAEGLKKAGYATNPNYAPILIKIIEDNNLHNLDLGIKEMPPVMDIAIPEREEPQKVEVKVEIAKPKEVVDIDNYTVSIQGQNGRHTVYRNNGSQFITIAAGDTFNAIASEFGLSVKQLVTFNDLPNDNLPAEGEMLYIKQKSKRSENGKLIHIAKDGETMHSISQMYGIRMNNLCNINRRPKDSELKSGQQIRLM